MEDAAYKLYLGISENAKDAISFSKIITLLKNQPKLRTNKFSEANIDSPDIQEKLASSFKKGRQLKYPTLSVSPDDMAMSIIAECWFSVPKSDMVNFFNYHKQAMAAENIIGAYLEAYIDSVLSNHGWIWCSGSIVNKVDFIKFEKGKLVKYLQVKCRDNTENSSSQSVRDGTKIEKWFRMFSKTGKTNWGNFPDKKVKHLLCEKDFLTFLREKITRK